MEPYNISQSRAVSLQRKNFLDGNFTGFRSNQNVVVASFRNGWKQPPWRELVRDHRNATTPCSGVQRSVDPGYAEVWASRYANSGKLDNTYLSIGELIRDVVVPGIPSLPGASLDNAALMRFYSSANSKINQASGMVALGELRETVRQLKHPFRSMRDLLVKREKSLKGKWNRLNRVKSVKDRKILGRDLKNAAAGTWLEVQFGLKPLVSDIEDALSYLQHRKFQLGVEYFNIKGTARTYSTTGWTTGISGSYRLHIVLDSIYYYTSRRTDSRQKVRYHGELRVDPLSSSWTYRDFGRLGLGLRQFAPTLWELTPWSFLVDYFLDVGGLIDSFNVPREDIVWFNKTRRSEVRQTTNLNGSNNGTVYGVGYRLVPEGYQARPAVVIVKQFDRAGGQQFSLPRPKISFDLPSGKKIVNMFALAAVDSRSRFSKPL